MKKLGWGWEKTVSCLDKPSEPLDGTLLTSRSSSLDTSDSHLGGGGSDGGLDWTGLDHSAGRAPELDWTVYLHSVQCATTNLGVMIIAIKTFMNIASIWVWSSPHWGDLSCHANWKSWRKGAVSLGERLNLTSAPSPPPINKGSQSARVHLPCGNQGIWFCELSASVRINTEPRTRAHTHTHVVTGSMQPVSWGSPQHWELMAGYYKGAMERRGHERTHIYYQWIQLL